MAYLMEFMEVQLPRLISYGFGYGTLLGGISALTGYAVGKVLSLIDDK
ncbi:MAG: hypothetical protein NC489_46795 [Ruminococcus flavefaciens]|nr:hypothetical protein [Ruminococcus flavefaciens]